MWNCTIMFCFINMINFKLLQIIIMCALLPWTLKYYNETLLILAIYSWNLFLVAPAIRRC